MTITINNDIQISAIQDEFNAVFPYLRIEFISETLQSRNTSLIKVLKTPSKTLNEYRTIHSKCNVTITPQMTVIDLKKIFRKNYGLRVQISRKSGKVWLKTTVTEDWTLEEQNKQGEALSL